MHAIFLPPGLRWVLLVLVATLKLVAPLIHAHAHGVSADGHAHLHWKGMAAGAAAVTAPEADNPAISVPTEFKRDVWDFDVALPALWVSVSLVLFLLARVAVPGAPARGRPRHLFPRAQAPPAA